MAEKFYWADEVANQIIKKHPKKKQYVCASGITPSGKVHIGNFREIITTELVVRALNDKGKKTRFVYSWDDYDRFRKVPKGIPKSYEKYLGMPLSEIPSPFEKNNSYARHFEELFEKSLKKVGVYPEFIQQHLMNKKCKYSELIKIVLNKKDKIIKILDKYRKEPLAKDWYPIMVYCEKCGKDSTKILSTKDYEIEYECGCGHKEKFDYRKNGLVSVKWRIDWPMRWKYEDVVFEPGGIDHSVKGGSLTTAREIIGDIFGGDIPFYVFYDWITIKGIELKNFHSSKGNVLDLNDVLEIYEPEILRYIFVSQKPRTGFEISFDNDVIKIYEDYDSLEGKYYSNKANPRERRIYELSQVDKFKKTKPNKTGFRHLMTFIQTGKKIDISDKPRAERIKNWLDKYAGEDMKFEVQTKIQIKPNAKEKKILLALKNVLEKKKYTEEQLFNQFYDITKDLGISNTEFFQICYRTIINKERGPRLANLIINVGQDKIIKLLNQIK